MFFVQLLFFVELLLYIKRCKLLCVTNYAAKLQIISQFEKDSQHFLSLFQILAVTLS